MRYRSSRAWPYHVFVAGMFLVARNDQPGTEVHRVCTHCLQYEGNLPKAPLHPLVSSTPLDLLHIDFTSIKMTIELNRLPRVVNVLVFQDHFTKHIMVYMTPDQTDKTVIKYLYQGYISVFGAVARFLSDCGSNFISSIIGEM